MCASGGTLLIDYIIVDHMHLLLLLVDGLDLPCSPPLFHSIPSSHGTELENEASQGL